MRSSMKKALIITGEGYQDQEVLYPYYRLKEDGFEVDVAAAALGEIHGILGTKISATTSFREVQEPHYQLLILPGGVKALEKIRQEKKVIEFIRIFHDSGKIIGSICHGAQLLISARVVKGKKISAYYSIKDDVENAGALYVDAPVVVDGNIVSSPHYKHLGEWMGATLKQFYQRENRASRIENE